mgnify:CR=1 FL=1
MVVALAGIPGTVGFIAKYSVFDAAVVNGHLELTIIGVIASMIGFYYYLRVIWSMYFVTADAPAMNEADMMTVQIAPASMVSGTGIAALSASKVVATTRPIAIGAMISLALALIGTIVLGIIPGPLFDLARQAAGLP